MIAKIYIPILLLTGLLCASASFSQNHAFIMSSVGNMGNNISLVTSINFMSDAKCIEVQNGLSTLTVIPNNKTFIIDCDVKVDFNQLALSIYPNPASENAHIKFNQAPPLTEIFDVSLWNAHGGIIGSRKESGYNLFQGILLSVSGLQTGVYVIRIESEHYLDALKFIVGN